MFKPLFKLTFITFVWRQYKQLIISTLLLFLFMWLVGKVHQDYLDYSELRNHTDNLGWSFIIKWLALVCGILVYMLYHSWYKPRNNKKPTSNATNSSPKQQQNDPFSQLREKQQLRSKGDLLIEQHVIQSRKK